MRKSWLCTLWAIGALSASCGEVYEFEQPPVLEPVAEVRHGLIVTTTYTLSWPDNQATGDCRFGDTSLNHQPATAARASGRLEQPLSITGLAGRRITGIQLSSATSTFKYDDVLLLAYSEHLVMTSDRRVAQYSANSTSLGTSPVAYSWSNILNGDIGNVGAQSPWCTSGATSCTVPPTETAGALSVNVPDFTAVDAAAYPSSPGTRTFKLVTIGDDDPTLDCRHGPINLTLTVTHEEATCTDGVKNGSETDVDCGGSVCPKCQYDESCLVASDCNTNTCWLNKCAGRSCKQLRELGFSTSGNYVLDVDGTGTISGHSFYCDMTTDGGGWTQIAPCDAKNVLQGTMTAVDAATLSGYDSSCRPYTLDGGESHTFYYQFRFPPGYSEFFLVNYNVRSLNPSTGIDASEIYPSSFIQTSWSVAAGSTASTGDISFGTNLQSGPVTSYARQLSLPVGVRNSTISWPAGTQRFTVPLSTNFRIGWGESGPEQEGWYPWWSGNIRLR